MIEYLLDTDTISLLQEQHPNVVRRVPELSARFPREKKRMSLMNRTRSLWMLAVVAGASCVWWTGLQADDKAAPAPPPSQTAELLARIEKLERRVETLEQNRQIDPQLVPAAGLLNGRPEDAKSASPHGALIVPPQAARPAGTVFLPRQIVVKPE